MNEFLVFLLHEFKLPLENPVLVFSLILFIILLAPILLRRINIPGIVGLIVSGVIIGPNGLNILEKNSAVELFSTIGLLYILFIAGLDLDLNEFRSNRNKSYLFGFLTFIFPLILCYPVCYYYLGFSFNASLLISSMLSAHTLIAYQIVNKLGISKNQAVAITVGGTILADTAVLISLALILANNQSQLALEFWIKLGISLSVFSFIIFYLIPKIAKWFFHQHEEDKHAHYIFSLLIVFFAAFLSELAGLEPIIGAFLSGLALNRLIPHSSALMNRIEFIGNSLFIPFFLISVGMLVDLSGVLENPKILILAAIFSFIGIFGKWIAAFLTQKIFRFSKYQRQLIFGLSSSRAAAALALVLVGYESEILDRNVLNATIILILVTCIFASFVTDKAAKKIIIETVEDNSANIQLKIDQSHEHILLPIANISNFDRLLEFALLIKDKKSINPISILSVVPNNEDAEINIISARSKLQDFVKQASAFEMNVNVIATIDYNSTSGITRTIKEIMANILILGWSANTESTHRMLSDKVESIIHSNNKTVLVCHINQPLITIKNICIICPPITEKEIGFGIWLGKIAKLSIEISSPILWYGTSQTNELANRHFKNSNSSAKITFNTYSDIDDLLSQSFDINLDDLLIMVNSRRGSVSYSNNLDHSLLKLEKHINCNNKLLIYPQRYEQQYSIS